MYIFNETMLKILATTMDKGGVSGSTVETKNDYHNEFFNTGRVGRRNAMPDILGHHCTTSTSDLPDQLRALTTDETHQATPSASEPSSSNGQVNTNEATTTSTNLNS